MSKMVSTPLVVMELAVGFDSRSTSVVGPRKLQAANADGSRV